MLFVVFLMLECSIVKLFSVCLFVTPPLGSLTQANLTLFDDQMPVLRRISRLEKKKDRAKRARQPISSLSLESPMDIDPSVNLGHLCNTLKIVSFKVELK